MLAAAREALEEAKRAPELLVEQFAELKAKIEAKLAEQNKNGAAIRAADVLEKSLVVALLAATKSVELPVEIANVQDLMLPQRMWLVSHGLR